MAGDTKLFLVEKVKIGKVWDKAMTKTAGDALLAGVEKALNTSGAKVVSSFGKDEKGFRVTLTLESLELNEKKGALEQLVKGVITAMPDDKYLAGLTHSGKLPDVNMKKIEADVKFLCTDSGAKLGEKIRKEV